MHPEIAKTLIAQRHNELTQHSVPRPRRRRLPRWHVSWTRTVLAPVAMAAATGTNRAGYAGRPGSSLVIIISAHRSA
jgi:hypothetical protein